MTLQPSEKLFLQTVGRFVAERIAERLMPLSAQIDELKSEVRELKSQVRELEEGGIKYCGVYQKAANYKRGDCVSYDGSMWCAITDVNAMEVPGPSNCWQLAVKHGRDGRSRRDADAGVNAA
jgi:hypothetical protein